MADETKMIMEWLRTEACNGCIFAQRPVGECVTASECMARKAADLIETLLLVVEQKDRELAGMRFLLTSAQSDADRFKRERDELLGK